MMIIIMTMMMTNIIIKTLMIRSRLFDYNDYNDTQVHYAEDFDIVMPMYNLMEYSDAYLNTSRSLWYYYRDEPALYYNGNIIDFPANNNSNNNNINNNNNNSNNNNINNNNNSNNNNDNNNNNSFKCKGTTNL